MLASSFAPVAADGAASKVTPVYRLVELLTGMVEKGKAEMKAEQVQFAAYKQFCDDTTVEKQRAIKEANEGTTEVHDVRGLEALKMFDSYHRGW